MKTHCLFFAAALLAPPAAAGDILYVADSDNNVVWRCVDVLNDGSYDQPGDVSVFYDDATGAFPLTNNVGIVWGPGGTVYVCDSTEDIILALRDLDGDGDALDMGEATIFFDGRAGGNADGVLMTSANSVPQYSDDRFAR
jgi:sugar lactone lactonase YvrE